MLAAATDPLGCDDEFYGGRVAKIFDEEDVLLVAGSDAGIFTNIPGLSLAKELELLVQAGISPFNALRSATLNPALVLNEPNRGCVTAGCVADLVLYAWDILSDIACLRRPHGVLRLGAVPQGDDLKRLLADAATPDIERTQANLLSRLKAQGTSFEPQGEETALAGSPPAAK